MPDKRYQRGTVSSVGDAERWPARAKEGKMNPDLTSSAIVPIVSAMLDSGQYDEYTKNENV